MSMTSFGAHYRYYQANNNHNVAKEPKEEEKTPRMAKSDSDDEQNLVVRQRVQSIWRRPQHQPQPPRFRTPSRSVPRDILRMSSTPDHRPQQQRQTRSSSELRTCELCGMLRPIILFAPQDSYCSSCRTAYSRGYTIGFKVCNRHMEFLEQENRRLAQKLAKLRAVMEED